MRKSIIISFNIILLAGIVIFSSSCRQEDPPRAVVNIVDESDKPVSGAMVIVKAVNADSLQTAIYLQDGMKLVADTQYTSTDGKIEYDFKYESIYKVEVTKTSNYSPTKRGVGILVLENGKTYETTIELNEQTVF